MDPIIINLYKPSNFNARFIFERVKNGISTSQIMGCEHIRVIPENGQVRIGLCNEKPSEKVRLDNLTVQGESYPNIEELSKSIDNFLNRVHA